MVEVKNLSLRLKNQNKHNFISVQVTAHNIQKHLHLYKQTPVLWKQIYNKITFKSFFFIT